MVDRRGGPFSSRQGREDVFCRSCLGHLLSLASEYRVETFLVATNEDSSFPLLPSPSPDWKCPQVRSAAPVSRPQVNSLLFFFSVLRAFGNPREILSL